MPVRHSFHSFFLVPFCRFSLLASTSIDKPSISSHERLNIDLDSADGIFELEFLQYGGVKDSESANNLLLTVNSEVNCCRVAREVCWV